jgi:hypothetical protein
MNGAGGRKAESDGSREKWEETEKTQGRLEDSNWNNSIRSNAIDSS